MVKLIKREIDLLACPPDKRDVLVFDDELRGFALRVTPAGTKTFLLQYRRGEAVHRLTLGRYGELSPIEARRLAEQARGRIAAGGHPVAEKIATLAAEKAERAAKKQARTDAAFTLEKLVQQWAAVGLKDRSAAHRKDAPATLARDLAAMWKRPANAITAKAAQTRIDEIARSSPAAAEHVRSYARAAFNWGVKRSTVEVTFNPFAAIDVSKVPSRERALSEAELGAVWNAAGALAYPFGPLVRLLLLTMQRKTEVAAMRWSELSADGGTWTLPAPRAKNRKAHIVHLSAPARAILAGIKRRAGCDLVFTTTGTTPVSGFSKAVEQLRAAVAEALGEDATAAAASAGDWRLHDFRRTGATQMAELGVAPHIAERVLNHVQTGVQAIYQKAEFLKERAAALDLWAAHVLAVARAAGGQEDAG